MKMVAPKLETERLLLFDMEEQDTANVVKWRSVPEVYCFFLAQHPLSEQEHLNWYRNSYIYNINRYDWVARKKEDNQPIGIFGVKRESEQSMVAEVSYILAPEHQGKGYASEAVLRTMQFAKECWECDRVVAEIHVKNKASIEFVQRLGFVYVSSNGDFCIYERKV